MFPMEFDHHILSSLPVPGEEGVKDVLQRMESIVSQHIIPYFKRYRGTDAIHAALLKDKLVVRRLEDENAQIKNVSLSMRAEDGWIVLIHERIFDYLAFVIPSRPESRSKKATFEEQKMLAFAEFFLRHEIEHMLYPERKEVEVIEADVQFAMEKRETDPTYFQMLYNALADEMTGLRGERYLEIFELVRKGKPYEHIVNRIINNYVVALRELPIGVLQRVFFLLDTNIKVRVLGECYRRSRNTGFSLVQRTSCFQQLLRLFAMLIKKNEKEAREVFHAFKDRWGLAILFHELDLPEATVEEGRDVGELFELFKLSLQGLPEEFQVRQASMHKIPSLHPERPAPKTKSLNDRIEDARRDPTFPHQVLEVIDKNKMNAIGQSGAKYAEFIENLLSIPWGRIRKIDVSPADFEEGLNLSHYGLERPKEVLCDFFSNLIWRYRRFSEESAGSWHRTGGAIMLVGPPGVGKTSLAISIARNLGIPYHKISLGGMRDEADIRGHGFTYEGSKPGPIVQGLIKAGAMNCMFIMDEADKTEKFAIATLLEILDPEQNHLFHDKYTQTNIDIDLSNCIFVLTANTLETVPPAVVNRCEVIFLDRYSVDEKIAIARHFLVQRIRERYGIETEEIYFDPEQESDLLRYLVRNYSFEAGVRSLERTIRTLFLRAQRKEILTGGKSSVRITEEKIREHLDPPDPPRKINNDDRVGEMLALGVNVEVGMGSIIPIQVTRVHMGGGPGGGNRRSYMSLVHATGNIEKIMDESRKVATTGIFHCARELGIKLDHLDDPIHIHFMGGSTKKDGPSSGGAIALALASLLLNRKVRRDVAMTGEVDTQGRIAGIGALDLKLETAYAAGCKTMIIPRENLYGKGGIERFPAALKRELQILTYDKWKGPHEPFDYARHMLQVVAVDDIIQAADVAFIDERELDAIEELSRTDGLRAAEALAAGKAEPSQPLRIIRMDDLEDYDLEVTGSLMREVGGRVVLVVNPDVKDIIGAGYSDMGEHVEVWGFDPDRDDIADVLKRIVRSSDKGDLAVAQLVSLEAPRAFLNRHVSPGGGLPLDPIFEKIRTFANDCTVEKVKIKGCRRFIGRLYHYLARLDAAVLDTSPFMFRKDGIYSIGLSFIPEKYRLDAQRSEEILHRCLTRWLTSVEEPRPREEPVEGLPDRKTDTAVAAH